MTLPMTPVEDGRYFVGPRRGQESRAVARGNDISSRRLVRDYLRMVELVF